MIKFDTEKSEVPMLPPENEETFYYVQMLIEGKEEVPGTQDSWIEVCFFSQLMIVLDCCNFHSDKAWY